MKDNNTGDNNKNEQGQDYNHSEDVNGESLQQPPSPSLENNGNKRSYTGIATLVIVLLLIGLIGAKDKLTFWKKSEPDSQLSIENLPPEESVKVNNSGNVTSSEAQLTKEGVQEIIKNYINDNPEIVMDAIQKLEQKAVEQKAKASKDFIDKNMNQLTADEPYIGNKDGTIAIVDFFDYRCGYCKRSHLTLLRILKEYNNVKVVLKNVPILGESSTLAAQSSIAVWKISPKDFASFHDSLMSTKEINTQVIESLAAKHKIPQDALFTAMRSPETQAIIDNNIRMAQGAGVRGVPAFIINDEFIPGSMSYEVFKQKIEDIQKNKS